MQRILNWKIATLSRDIELERRKETCQLKARLIAIKIKNLNFAFVKSNNGNRFKLATKDKVARVKVFNAVSSACKLPKNRMLHLVIQTDLARISDF